MGSWITAEAGYDYTQWHFRLGYFALGLLLFRLLWGLFGTTHARFTSFVRMPWHAVIYLREIARRDGESTIGHSPAGGWATLILLTLVGVQAGTGLFISDDIFWAGPYNGAVSSDLAGQLANIHHLNFTGLQVMVALHLVVIAWYAWGRRVNLVTPMINGRKTLPFEPTQSTPGAESQRIGLAVVLAALSAMVIYALIAFAPPPAPSLYDF